MLVDSPDQTSLKEPLDDRDRLVVLQAADSSELPHIGPAARAQHTQQFVVDMRAQGRGMTVRTVRNRPHDREIRVVTSIFLRTVVSGQPSATVRNRPQTVRREIRVVTRILA